MTNASWSEELQKTTRKVLDEKGLMPVRNHVYLKNVDGRFGQVGIED